VCSSDLHKTSTREGNDVLTDEGMKFRELFLKHVVVNLLLLDHTISL
jgi:hypothetical protein